MNRNVKIACLLFLLIFSFCVFAVIPTFAKFNDQYVTQDDVVGFQFNFDLKLSNIEEYEEVSVPSNSYEVFQVNIYNSTGNTIYYGVWYKMAIPSTIESGMVIARLESNLTEMTGELAPFEDKTVSVIIKNNSSSDMMVNIGVDSSLTGVQDIEYLGGKYLITGSANEFDYYYDDVNKKYVSSIDSNQFFTLNSVGFRVDDVKKFTSNHLGSYKLEAWSAGGESSKGSYATGILSLDKNDNLYFDIGKEKVKDEEVNTSTVVSLSSLDVESDVDNRIMIVGDKSYISGRFGDIAFRFSDEELKKKCVTGKEDVLCSHHLSGKYFNRIQYLDGTQEMSSFDGKSKMIGNQGNGYVKITPVVPTLNIPKLSVAIGEELDLSEVECVDGGNGCHIVKTLPSTTKDLTVGSYNIMFMVRDDDGVVYRYQSNFDVVA